MCAFIALTSQITHAQNTENNLYFEQSLFEHLHERYLNAITLSEVLSEKTNQRDIQQHVLLSNSYYQYQLPEKSLDLLTQNLGQKLSKNDHDILLFNIAKNHYNHHRLDEALQTFNQIKVPINPQILDELNYLKADSYLKTNQIEQAEISSKALSLSDAYFPYVAHNMAIHFLNNNQAEKAFIWTNLFNTHPSTKDGSLSDSLLLSTGIYLIRNQQYSKAVESLLQINKESVFAAKGLLALGRALTLDQNKEEGTRFYNYLSNYPKQNIYYQESLINLAETYDSTEAITLFKHAISQYNDLIENIDDITQSVNNTVLTDCLVGLNSSAFCSNTQQWLIHFSQRDTYKLRLIQHKQLQNIQSKLYEWSEKIPVYHFILKQRKDDFNQKLPLIKEKFNPTELASLTTQYNELNNEYNNIKNNNHPFPFINEDESDLIDDIDYVDVTVKRINKEAVAELKERAEFAKGILMWELAQQQPHRQRAISKNLTEIKSLLETASRGMKKLNEFENIGDLRLDLLTTELNEAENMLKLMENQVSLLIEQNRQHITSLAKAYLQQRKARLISLNSRSKFLLTQLQDKQ